MSEWRKVAQIPKHGVLALPTDMVLVCCVDDQFYELVIPERPRPAKMPRSQAEDETRWARAAQAQADFGPGLPREYMDNE